MTEVADAEVVPQCVHDRLALEAREERNQEAKAIVAFLKERLVMMQAYERRFVETVDAEKVSNGALEWAEEIARHLGYQKS